MNPASIRNIGIIAHIDAGKTTLSERILFYCQKIHKLGEVHDGAATMDFMPEEQERGITIASACATCQWKDASINLVDTPGHVDFTMEVERCLAVLDGAVGVFCAVGGVEPQSETVWRQSEYFNIPKLAFINKMDRQGANFQGVVEDLRQRLGANAIPVVLPLGSSETFAGIIDLVNWQKLTFDQASQGRVVNSSALSPEEEAQAAPARDYLLEKLAEADDAFLALWLDGVFAKKDILAALRRATLARAIVPVYCGSALRNIGVQPLLDGVSLFLPSPLEAAPALGELKNGDKIEINADPAASPVAFVFKTIFESGRKNCFIRLYAGTIREGDALCSAATGKQDRIGRLFRISADRRERLESLGAGDIAAVAGLRGATGDTYYEAGHETRLAAIPILAPVITLALEPKNADEGKLLDEALARYTAEDPTLKYSLDEESGLRMISGMGELHLDVLLERLAREYKISPRKGQPQVVLREAITMPGSADFTFDRELGKERHHGQVSLTVTPLPRGSGTVVKTGDFLPENPVAARKIMPQAFLDAVLEGARDGLQSGTLGGWPVVDAEVVITGIEKMDGVTTVPGLRMAAGQALKRALENAAPVYLEPIMQVEITTPEDFLGAVIGLFNQLGGKVEEVDDHAGAKYLKGAAPLRALFGFSTSLRSATQGRAGFMMKFRAFDQA